MAKKGSDARENSEGNAIFFFPSPYFSSCIIFYSPFYAWKRPLEKATGYDSSLTDNNEENNSPQILYVPESTKFLWRKILSWNIIEPRKLTMK